MRRRTQASAALLAALCWVCAAAACAHAEEWTTSYDLPDGSGTVGFKFLDPLAGFYTSSLHDPFGAGPRGLWLWPTGSLGQTLPYDGSPPPGGQWTYEAPGQAQVLKADVSGIARRDERYNQALEFAIDGDTEIGGAAASWADFGIAPITGAATTLDAEAAGGGKDLNLYLITSEPCSALNPNGCPPAYKPATLDPAYAFSRVEKVELTLSDPDAPAAQLGGPLAGLADGRWTSAGGKLSASVAGSDQTSGVDSVSLSDDGDQLLEAAAPCDADHATPGYAGRECPLAFAATFSFDLDALDDGEHEITAAAEDFSGELTEETFELNIDRTAPDAPEDASWHEGTRGASLSWAEAEDETSGVDHYVWQASRDGGVTVCEQGTTTALRSPTTGAAACGGIGSGVEIALRAAAVDKAGNAGAFTAWAGGLVAVPAQTVRRATADGDRPLDAKWLRGDLTLRVSADDPRGSGVDHVAFRIDGDPVASCPDDTDSPYACTVDTSIYDDGARPVSIATADRAEPDAHVATDVATLRFDNTPPPSPPGLTITRTDGQARASWGESTAGAGSPIARYEGRYRLGAGQFTDWAVANSRELTVDGVAASDEAVFQVRAFDEAGNESKVASSDTPGDPDPPAAPPCPGPPVTCAPAALTQPATAVTLDRAQLNATINPKGQKTTGFLQYGKSVDYGANTDPAPVGHDDKDRPLGAVAAKLTPSTAYHYRVVAANASGTTYGADATFRTADPPPVVEKESGSICDTDPICGEVDEGDVQLRTADRPKSKCYRPRKRVYRWPYPSSNLPLCRTTLRERERFDQQATKRNSRVKVKALAPAAAVRGRYSLLDSSGTAFAFLESAPDPVTGRPNPKDGRWRVFDKRGRLVGTTKAGREFQVQGRGCMLRDRNSYLIVALYAGNGREGEGGKGAAPVYLGLRGFMSATAIQGAKRTRAKKKIYDNCGSGTLKLVKGRDAFRTDDIDVAPFQRVHKYVGSSSMQRGCEPTGDGCGSLANYQSLPGMPVRLITSASTGVVGGGIVRAVVPAGASAARLDEIGYCDPNVPAGQNERALWVLLRWRGIAGWLPTRRSASACARLERKRSAARQP